MTKDNSEVIGKITQVFGAVVDVVFTEGALPAIETALKVTNQAIDDIEGKTQMEIVVQEIIEDKITIEKKDSDIDASIED